MNFGFYALHPVTLPIGNELTQAALNASGYLFTRYVCYIKPVLAELIETIRLCT